MQLEGLTLQPGIMIDIPAPPVLYYVRTFGNDLTSPIGQVLTGTPNSIVYDTYDNLYATGLGYTSSIGNQGLVVKFKPDTTVDWQKLLSTGSTSNYTFLRSIDRDNANNIYVSGVVALNWLSSTKTSTFQVAKYNSSGVLQWQVDLGSGFTNSVPSFGTDLVVEKSTGNFYVTGDAVIGPTSGSQPTDMTLIKYNTSGSVLWSIDIGLSGRSSHSNGVALDSSGNVYIVGVATLSSPAQSAAIVKYNSSGVLQWQKCLSGPTNGDTNQFNGIAIDSSNNIFVCGTTYVSTNLLGMIVKYNSSGTLVWQRQISGQLTSIAVDSAGNVYAVGSTLSNNGLIVKYDTNGVIQWQRQVTGQDSSLGPALINFSSITFDSLDIMTMAGQLTPDQLRSNSNMFIFKVPSDGTLTDTYQVNEYDITYEESNFTEAALSQTQVTSSMSNAYVDYFGAGPSSLSDTTSSFVNIVTPIP